METKEKTPVEELRELIPQLEESDVCPAEISTVKSAIEQAVGNSLYRTKHLEASVGYLRDIAEKTEYYRSRPKTQTLLRQAVGLIAKIE